MNIYSLLSLIASVISISLGASVYFLNKKSTVNKLFLLTMIANAYWAFCEYMMSQATSAESAALWSKALSFWPFLVALLVNFTLAFTENDLLTNKLTYVALYFPTLLFSMIDLTTNWISLTPHLTSWGFVASFTASIITRIYSVWVAILGFLALFFFTNYYYRVIDKTKRQQTKFIAIGFAIPILISLITDSIFPAININFPVLGNISGSLTSFFVVYAMLRYELFGFRPEIAAENVFSTMPDSVILVNLQGEIVKVNRSFVEVSGYNENDMVGMTIGEIAQKAGVLKNFYTPPQIMAEILKQGNMKDFEVTFYSKSGQKRTGTVSSSMVHDNRGQDVGVAFVLHDNTEKKEMEQKLIKNERFASIGELAGILGHDLRNPLMGIRGASYYLKTKHADILDNTDQTMFESIDKSINYSDKIINDLIDYSSEIVLDLETATPKALIENALTQIAAPQDVVVKDETKETPSFQVDVEKIHRGFANIVKNIFDAMPEGGELTIKSEQIGNFVVFSFRDTGDGMTQETLDKVWTPLFTTKAKGMGFGLAISKRAVEAHAGKISAESSLKEGTTIRVELPLNRKALDG